MLAVGLLLMAVLPGCGGEDAGQDGTGGSSPATAGQQGTDLSGTNLGGTTTAGSATAGDGSVFDPNNIDNALQWWIARTRELGEAQRSGNQLRIDAAMQDFDAARQSIVGQRIRYTFGVERPSVGGALATGDAISAQGVHVSLHHTHPNDLGAIRIGSQFDAGGRRHVESTPILLKPGEHIDSQMLLQLSTRSRFDISARIVDTAWLGATFMRPPTLILFVDDVRVEQIHP